MRISRENNILLIFRKIHYELSSRCFTMGSKFFAAEIKMFEAEEEVAPRYAIHCLHCFYYSIFFHLKIKKNCLRQRRRAEEEAAELSDFQLSVAVSPTTPLPAQQSSPAAAIEFKLHFPSVKSFMIPGFLVLHR